MRPISVFFILLVLLFTVLVFERIAIAQTEDRAALERQLADLESQISQHEALVEQYKKQGKNLQNEISSLNAKINKLNLQIKAITLNLKKLDAEITGTKSQILITEQKIELNKEALRKALRSVYENDRLGLAAILLGRPKLSDFVGDLQNLERLQNSLTTMVQEITQLRSQLVEEKESLEEKRDDAAALKTAQDAQRHSLNSVKSEKSTLLTATKGQESKFQEILKEKRKQAAQIRSRIFEFLGGGELTFEKAYEFAKFAEQATGVRAAMILAVLEKESALGQNVGRCNYKTAMHPTRDAPIFLALTAALNINPDTITVSCPNRDGAYGGAMGPAQFIPSTWNLYSAKTAEVTGSNPPSPWRHSDAFVATALYLKDSIRGCEALYGKVLDVERCAAAKYYAGGRWRRHLWGYGDRVVTKAQQFQNDIDILNS